MLSNNSLTEPPCKIFFTDIPQIGTFYKNVLYCQWKSTKQKGWQVSRKQVQVCWTTMTNSESIHKCRDTRDKFTWCKYLAHPKTAWWWRVPPARLVCLDRSRSRPTRGTCSRCPWAAWSLWSGDCPARCHRPLRRRLASRQPSRRCTVWQVPLHREPAHPTPATPSPCWWQSLAGSVALTACLKQTQDQTVVDVLWTSCTTSCCCLLHQIHNIWDTSRCCGFVVGFQLVVKLIDLLWNCCTTSCTTSQSNEVWATLLSSNALKLHCFDLSYDLLHNLLYDTTNRSNGVWVLICCGVVVAETAAAKLKSTRNSQHCDKITTSCTTSPPTSTTNRSNGV